MALTCKELQYEVVDTFEIVKFTAEMENSPLPGYSGARKVRNLESELNTENCICCLIENVPFVRLTNCKHVEFFECFLNFKLEYAESLVCYWCHKTLQEIFLFKKQVESSILSLNNQVQNLKPSNTNISKLSRSDTEIFYTHNSEPLGKEVIPKPIIERSTEVKVEFTFSDTENDIPLSEIKAKKVKMKKIAPIKNYEGKIKCVFLSEDEMWEERKKEAMKEAYLNLPYKCENCVTGFDHELTFKDHLDKRHNKKNGGYVCNICKSVLRSEGSYRDHTRRHYRRIECVACATRYSTVQSVVTHYDKTHGGEPSQLRCPHCEFTTESYRSFRYHRDKHKQKPSCEVCGNSFVNNAALKIHMFTVHKVSNRVYSCRQCDKVYNARSGLLAHTASVHASASAFAYCAPCKTHFRTLHNLKHHLNTHSKHTSVDDKKYVCDECDARFLTKSQLKEHVEWTHRNSSAHKCPHCNKVFKNGTGLRRHLSYVHEKKRPPRNKICDHCGRGFTTLSILRAHIRTHTGERPLRCAACAASFAHAAALYTHTKLLHAHKD